MQYYAQQVAAGDWFRLSSPRHGHETRSVDSGVDVVTVSKLLGHADVRTTLIYAKTQLPVLQTAVKKLEAQMPAAPETKLLE